VTEEDKKNLLDRMADFGVQLEDANVMPVIIVGASKIEGSDDTRIIVVTQLPPMVALVMATEGLKGIVQAVDRQTTALEGKLALASIAPLVVHPPQEEPQ
jgi:hypothetical protein